MKHSQRQSQEEKKRGQKKKINTVDEASNLIIEYLV